MFQATLSLMILHEGKRENTLVGRCSHTVHWDQAVGSESEKILEVHSFYPGTVFDDFVCSYC